MKTKSITLNQLGDEINKIINRLGIEYKEKINEEIQSTAKLINKDIRKTTAFNDYGDKHLKKSFSVVKKKSSIDEIVNYYVTANKNKKWRLTHLIEEGHRMINHDGSISSTRSFVESRPFLQPLLDLYSPIMLANVKKIIQSAKGD